MLKRKANRCKRAVEPSTFIVDMASLVYDVLLPILTEAYEDMKSSSNAGDARCWLVEIGLVNCRRTVVLGCAHPIVLSMLR